ncbi:MAG: peptidylprolyl isomerase [bacterium]
MRKAIIAVLLVVFVFGCNKKATSQESVSNSAKKGNVVIEVGDVKLTDEDVKEELAALPPQLQPYVATKEGKKEFIDSLVKRELLYQEAKAKGIENSEKVKRDLEKIKKRLLVDAFLREAISTDIKVDDNTLKEFYKKNEKKFVEPEKTHTKHILVKDKKLADEIAEKLKKSPELFEKLAAEHSVDSSGKNGGDIGAHEKGTLVPEYEAAMEKLKKPGDISPVVKSQFGYHIIKLVSREKSAAPKFEDIKDEIKEEYLRENQKNMFEKIVTDLKKKYTVKIKEEELDKIGADAHK